jgi:exosortase
MSSPEASYGLVLASAAAIVAARRWPRFVEAASARQPGVAGLGLAAAGALLHTVGVLGADVFLTRVSFVVMLAGSIWALAGWPALRTMTAPILFLLIAVPLPALIVNEITLPLQLGASRVAETMLSAASVPVYRDGNLLMLPSGTLAVAEACSGLRSAISLTAVGMILAWSTEPSLRRRTAIVLSAIPIAVFMNALRIMATGLMVEATGNPVPADTHSLMGWIVFVVSVGLLLGVQRWLEHRDESRRPVLSAPEPA